MLFPTSDMPPDSALHLETATACQIPAYLTPMTAAVQTLQTSIYQNTNEQWHAAQRNSVLTSTMNLLIVY